MINVRSTGCVTSAAAATIRVTLAGGQQSSNVRIGWEVSKWVVCLLALKITVPKALWHAIQMPFKSYTVEYLRHLCLHVSHLTLLRTFDTRSLLDA